MVWEIIFRQILCTGRMKKTTLQHEIRLREGLNFDSKRACRPAVYTFINTYLTNMYVKQVQFLQPNVKELPNDILTKLTFKPVSQHTKYVLKMVSNRSKVKLSQNFMLKINKVLNDRTLKLEGTLYLKFSNLVINSYKQPLFSQISIMFLIDQVRYINFYKF